MQYKLKQICYKELRFIYADKIAMNFFKKFTTYLHPQTQPKTAQNQSKVSQAKSTDSFQLILLDILDGSQQIAVELQEIQKQRGKREHRKSQDIFEELIVQQANNKKQEVNQIDMQEKMEEHEGIQNMYLKDFIFINKLQQARELTVEEWNQMIDKKNISLFPKKNIYFSIFKGLKFEVRKKSWQLFANTSQMKKQTTRTYKQLCNPSTIRAQNLSQIEKDVPRSKSVTQYTKELKNILVAYCALTGKDYTQGMNLIAGSLLTLLALENDEELKGFEIYEKQFEERVFWIFIGVMVWKKWQQIFDKNFQGLTERLKILQSLMSIHLPQIYQRLVDNEWDLTIFSQYYITIMLYNTPRQFSKIILDLFFLDGQNAIHSLIIRMMKMQEDKILGFSDQCQLMNYFKKEIILDCYRSVLGDKAKAKKLEDFQINFMKSLCI